VEVLFQPDPRSKRSVRCTAKLEEASNGKGRKFFVIHEQVLRPVFNNMVAPRGEVCPFVNPQG
jgi:hypothetical protein